MEAYINKDFLLYSDSLKAIQAMPEVLESIEPGLSKSVLAIDSSSTLTLSDQLLFIQRCRYLNSRLSGSEQIKAPEYLLAVTRDLEIIESYKQLFSVKEVDSSKQAFIINALENIAILETFPVNSLEYFFHEILFRKLKNYSLYLNTPGDYDRLYLDTLYLGSALIGANYSETCRLGQEKVDSLLPEARRQAEITGLYPVGAVVVVEEQWIRLISKTAGAIQFPNGAANIILITDKVANGSGVRATLVHELIHQTQGSYFFDAKKSKADAESILLLEGITEALLHEAVRRDTTGYYDSNVFERPYNRLAKFITRLTEDLAEKNNTSLLFELQILSEMELESREDRLMGTTGSRLGLFQRLKQEKILEDDRINKWVEEEEIAAVEKALLG